MSELPEVLWLNGTFGVGKSTTARALLQALPDARPFDPEQVGYMLEHAMVREPVPDFQEWPLWRRLVVLNLVELLRHTGDRLVVPMTVLREDFATEIFTGLAEHGVRVRHVLLHCGRDVLRARITAAEEHPGDPAASEETRRWRMSKVDDYQRALPWLRASAHVVDTTTAPTDEVVRAVLATLTRADSGARHG
ncbi:shikimate kinase [Crossiella equi]|uniref:Shikimate kinase n=1 Tax=Crossiella equi TaxID=130796 RepID=A0ABS5A4E7_9PSEU|nr:AAA family ATPase [Crossiella equi]MBP2471442.1 shikimate kinase [Crossiella equi]